MQVGQGFSDIPHIPAEQGTNTHCLSAVIILIPHLLGDGRCCLIETQKKRKTAGPLGDSIYHRKKESWYIGALRVESDQSSLC